MTASTEQRFATNKGPAAQRGPAAKAVAGEPAAAPDAAKKKSVLKSKKFLIAVVLLLVVGGAGYKFLAPHKAAKPTGGDVVALDATTLNLAGGHYLKLAISIQLVKGKASATGFFPDHAAELMIDEFSNRSVSSLSSNAARNKLTADLLNKIKSAYPGEVYDVFVTQFVTQ